MLAVVLVLWVFLALGAMSRFVDLKILFGAK